MERDMEIRFGERASVVEGCITSQGVKKRVMMLLCTRSLLSSQLGFER
mgnify:CR=1 FL=1